MSDCPSKASPPLTIRHNHDAEGAVMQYSTYIKASDVRAYASQDDFGDVIRKLYLPPDVPKWQQLVRAAVLVVGIIEQVRPTTLLSHDDLSYPPFSSVVVETEVCITLCTPPSTSLRQSGLPNG